MLYNLNFSFLLNIYLLLNAFLKCIETEPLSPRSVKTKYGVIRGVLRHFNKQNVPDLPSPLLKLPDRFSVEIFRSVPFAQPPIGNLRFLPPVSQNRWRGTKLANRFAPVCMQNTAEIASSDLSSSSSSGSSSSTTSTPTSSPSASSINLVNTHQHLNSELINNNKDKIHEFLSAPSTSSFVSNSFSSTLPSLNSSSSNASSILISVPSLSKNLKRTKREGSVDASSIRTLSKRNLDVKESSESSNIPNYIRHQSNTNNKLNSSNLNSSDTTDRRPARSTVGSTVSADDVNDQFDRHFISNLLRIHPAYFRPFVSYIRQQDEDCLYANLYVPYREESDAANYEPYPVVVFVHGESFNWGTGNAYDGSMLAGIGNVILVTLNYRLGVFGFMPSLIEGSVRTNHGILDVVASLHWIQENIAQFGGSTKNITLISHQNGAALVQFLMKSPLSKDLFKRAVLLSGSSLSNWALAEQPEFYTRMLASKVDCGLDTRTTPQDNLSNSNKFNSFLSSSSSSSPLNEITGLFHSIKFSRNQTANQLSSSDERIFQCLRSRSSEQLRTASIRLSSMFYSPFYSLFGPTVDSLLIIDKHLFSPLNLKMMNYLNSSNINKKLRISIANSNHDLLIGFGSSVPKFRPALKRMLLTLSKMSSSNGLHFFYEFLKDFISYISTLVHDGSLNDQNDLNELFFLNNSLLKALPRSTDDQQTNATNFLSTKQNDLLNIISSIFLDVMIIAPLFSAANIHHPGSAYAFFLPFEQTEDEFFDQELALFGPSLAGYYYNVTDGLGRFKTNQTGLKQVQQSQRLISSFLNFFRTGDPSGQDAQKDQIPDWPVYNLKSRSYMNMDKQWKIKSATSGRLTRLLKLVDILDEEQEAKNNPEFSKFRHKLASDIRLSEKLSYDLRKEQFASALNQITKHLDLKIQNLGYYDQKLKHQHLKSKTYNSSQINKSMSLSFSSLNGPVLYDPGGARNSINRSLNDLESKSRSFQNNFPNNLTTFISTGNLARIKDNKNQTDKNRSPINQFFSSFGFSTNGDGEKNKLFYSNAMVAIISAGLAMLFVNVFVIFLGYKCICIQRRRILKQQSDRSREKLNSKDNLGSNLSNQLTNSSSNNQNLQSSNQLTIENVENSTSKCYCGNQYCNCTDIDKLQLLNSDSSFFTTDTIITDQPLSQLVSPVCKLISSDNYNQTYGENYSKTYDTTNSINSQSKLNSTIENQLINNKFTTANFSNNLSANQLKDQLKLDENNLQNCDCNLLNTPMLAVLESTGDNSNLLTELSAIGCESNLYKFFEPNSYYAPFDPNTIESTALQTHAYQTTLPTNLSNTLSSTANLFSPNTTNLSTNEQSQQQSLPQIQAHTPQTIQLQLLTDHHLFSTSMQTNNN